MTNPLFHSAPFRYAGFDVVEVPVGTTIKDERTGETLTVEADGAVLAGQTFYCSPETKAALVKRFSENKA